MRRPKSMQTFTTHVTVEPEFDTAFYFTKIYTVQGVRFHVSVTDMEDQTWAFNMVLRDLEWKIVNAPLVPCWILDIEQRLQEIILCSIID